jgi:hypothetical protein
MVEFWKYLIGILVGGSLFAIIVYVFRNALSSLMLRASKVSLTGPAGVKLVISGQVAATIATDVLIELERMISRHLTRDEKQLFVDILHHQTPPKVKDLMPTFDRNNPEQLKPLRALRGIYFIRPEPESSRWTADTPIHVTRLGKIAAKHKPHLFEG